MNFQFSEARKHGQGMIYDIITSWRIPPLEFPSEEASAAWETYVNFFEREMRKFGDLDIVEVEGQRMYFFEYTYALKDWIYQTALQLGGTVANNQQPATNAPAPYMRREVTATRQQPQQTGKSGQEREAEQLKQEQADVNKQLRRALGG